MKTTLTLLPGELLSMSSCMRCVLGQLYGNFDRGLDALELNELSEDERYGFNYCSDDGSWTRLNTLWRQAIRERRAKR